MNEAGPYRVCSAGISIFHGNDLEEIGIPPEAWPCKLSRGHHNYTVRGPKFGAHNGARIEVQLKERKFYLKSLSNSRTMVGTPSIGWKGSVAEAWTVAMERSGWHDVPV